MKSAFLMMVLLTIPLQDAQSDLTLLQDGEPIEIIERKQYALTFPDPLFIDQKELDRISTNINKNIYVQPRNAIISDKGKIIGGKPGIALDLDRFNALLYAFFYEGKLNQIEIPKREIHPRINEELLTEIYIKKIGEFVTHYKESNKERSHNIVLSTEAINNHVVFPGEQFSFNKVVGERTKEKGYKHAPVIVNGEFEEDIGGGICQVSSTLFNAVSLKGIQMIERYTHSRKVPYVPEGKDATVSWWGPDFVFKNSYNQPILIRAKSQDGKMMVRIYSADDIKLQN